MVYQSIVGSTTNHLANQLNSYTVDGSSRISRIQVVNDSLTGSYVAIIET